MEEVEATGKIGVERLTDFSYRQLIELDARFLRQVRG